MKFGNTFIKSILVLIIICYIQCRKKGINKSKDANSLNARHSLPPIDADSYELSARNDRSKLPYKCSEKFLKLLIKAKYLINEIENAFNKSYSLCEPSNKDRSISELSSNQNDLNYNLNSSVLDNDNFDLKTKIKRQNCLRDKSHEKMIYIRQNCFMDTSDPKKKYIRQNCFMDTSDPKKIYIRQNCFMDTSDPKKKYIRQNCFMDTSNPKKIYIRQNCFMDTSDPKMKIKRENSLRVTNNHNKNESEEQDYNRLDKLSMKSKEPEVIEKKYIRKAKTTNL